MALVEQFILGAKSKWHLEALNCFPSHKMDFPFFPIGNELWRAA